MTIGFDLGDRSSWYCVLDEAGRVLLEQKVSTTPKTMQEVFGGMPRTRIALETGMHSPWISRMLSELGHEVIVAHARNVRLIGESRKKDDRLDAQTLARLARIDPQLLSPVKHRSAKAQANLTVIRARAGLVRARTALVNTARGLAKSYGERLRGCNVRNMNPEKAEALSPELQSALGPLLAAIHDIAKSAAVQDVAKAVAAVEDVAKASAVQDVAKAAATTESAEFYRPALVKALDFLSQTIQTVNEPEQLRSALNAAGQLQSVYSVVAAKAESIAAAAKRKLALAAWTAVILPPATSMRMSSWGAEPVPSIRRTCSNTSTGASSFI